MAFYAEGVAHPGPRGATHARPSNRAIAPQQGQPFIRPGRGFGPGPFRSWARKCSASVFLEKNEAGLQKKRTTNRNSTILKVRKLILAGDASDRSCPGRHWHHIKKTAKDFVHLWKIRKIQL